MHLEGKRKFDSFHIALYFWARQFDGEGFTGKESCAFKGKKV